MQLTLDIQPEDLSLGIIEILSSLPQEEKIKIASNLIDKWLNADPEKEKEIYRNDVICKLMQNQKISEAEAKNNYQYREQMSKFESTQSKIIKAMFKELERTAIDIVNDRVKNSEITQTTFEACLKTVGDNFPDYVMKAIQSWFMNNIAQWSHEIYRSSMELPNLETSISNIKEKLRKMGAEF